MEQQINYTLMQRLKRLGVGLHYCGWFNGYISIEGDCNKFEVMWTTDKTTHNPFDGPAVSVEYTNVGFGYVYRSALTMRPVSKDADKQYWAKWLENKINQAYDKKTRLTLIKRLLTYFK